VTRADPRSGIAPPQNGQKVAEFVEGDSARPVEEAAVAIEFRHFLPEHDARILKHFFGIRRVDRLLGDEGIQPVTMLHQQRHEGGCVVGFPRLTRSRRRGRIGNSSPAAAG
jgi:hypothetical protein